MFDQNVQQPTGGPMMNMPMGANYNYMGYGPQQPTKIHNTLTAEQIDSLMSKEGQFSLQMTQEEYMKGICNHRTKDGTRDSLTFDPNNGTAHCVICGYDFRPLDANVSLEAVKDSCDTIIDILQTIKIMYIDLPAEAAKEFMQIIPLIGKIPKLYEFAVKNSIKHEDYNWRYMNRNMGSYAMLNNLEAMFSGGTPMMYGYPGTTQQPYGAGGYVDPSTYNNGGMTWQQPQPNPVYNNGPAFNPAMNSGFGYPGASMAQPAAPVGYNPGTPGNFSYNPNDPNRNGVPFSPTNGVTGNAQSPSAATNPPATPANAETTVTQNVTV